MPICKPCPACHSVSYILLVSHVLHAMSVMPDKFFIAWKNCFPCPACHSVMPDNFFMWHRSKKMSSSSEGECSQTAVQISEPIEIEDDEDPIEEDEDGPASGAKRKLTLVVWNVFKRVKYMGTTKAKCMYCFKKLSGETNHGTKHLHDHLKSCTLRKIKTAGNKTLSQSCLRFGSTDSGTVQVENYTFDLLVLPPRHSRGSTGT